MDPRLEKDEIVGSVGLFFDMLEFQQGVRSSASPNLL